MSRTWRSRFGVVAVAGLLSAGFLGLVATSDARAADAAPAAADPDPKALLKASVDDLYRGDQSVAVVEMHVKTARWERNLKMKVWSKGEEKSLIRIMEPKKE